MKANSSFMKPSLLLCFLTLVSTFSFGQNQPLDTIASTFFLAGASNTLLQKEQAEINAYCVLNSFWLAIRSDYGESPIADRRRITDFATTFEGYYGFSHSSRWNLGLRLKYSQRRVDNDASSSPFRVFQFKEEEANNKNLDKTYNGMTGVGLRVRFIPFEKIPALVVNGGYTFAAVGSEEYQENLGADRNMIDLVASYYLELNPNSYYYFIANGSALHPSNSGVRTSDDWLYNVGGSFFLVHQFFNHKFIVYPGLSYNIGFKPPDFLDQNLIKLNEQLLGVIGFQYQSAKGFSINTSFGIPVLLKTESLIVEQVRESYSLATIGVRKVF